MYVKHLFRRRLIFITFLMSLASAGTAFADTTSNDINADFIKAAFSGNLQEVERLLAKGADVNAKRDNGTTALIGASIEGHQEVVEFLLAKEANVDAKVYFFGRTGGATACDLASQKGHQEIVKLLIRAGAFYEGKIETYQEKKAPPPESNQQTRRK
jgi:uncharacterized protein